MLSSSGSKLSSLGGASTSSSPTSTSPVSGPAEDIKAAKRTLYTANAGDARAVLWCAPLLRTERVQEQSS